MKLAIGIALLALSSSGTQTGDGAISVVLGTTDGEVRFRIDPDGHMTAQEVGPHSFGPPAINLGPASYRRIRTLVAPVRRWAGSAVPCNDGPEPMADSSWARPTIVSWEGALKQVKVPLECMEGPAQDEIELVRAAVDQFSEWAEDSDAQAYSEQLNAVPDNVSMGED